MNPIISERGKEKGLKDKDVMVLEMDMVKFTSHKKHVDEVMKQFGRVKRLQIY